MQGFHSIHIIKDAPTMVGSWNRYDWIANPVAARPWLVRKQSQSATVVSPDILYENVGDWLVGPRIEECHNEISTADIIRLSKAGVQDWHSLVTGMLPTVTVVIDRTQNQGFHESEINSRRSTRPSLAVRDLREKATKVLSASSGS